MSRYADEALDAATANRLRNLDDFTGGNQAAKQSDELREALTNNRAGATLKERRLATKAWKRSGADLDDPVIRQTIRNGEFPSIRGGSGAFDDADRVIVELGAGREFQNLPKIARDNPNAHVFGIEHPEVKQWYDTTKEFPGITPELDAVAKGYDEAVEIENVKVGFFDYTTDKLPEGFADEVISIAPNPSGAAGGATPEQTADALTRVVKPGGRIYVASDNPRAIERIRKRLGVTPDAVQKVPRAEVPYASYYLDEYGE
ncbi:MAG: hypothetical protein GY938_27345, partial [Ketobacter sp.]|nr:hypothetical protein [Ketobacter sp.]